MEELIQPETTEAASGANTGGPTKNEEDDNVASNNKAPIPEQSKQNRRRFGLLVFSSLYTFLFVGAFFGWGPMQLLLEENGSFSSKCSEEDLEEGANVESDGSESEICPAQTAALVNIHFFAQISLVASPFLGQLLDYYGPTTVAWLMACASWIGLLLLVVAVEYLDALLYPSFLCIALSTWMGGMLSINTGMVFSKGSRMRPRVIILLNALFDAGSITYLGLWGVKEALGSSLSLTRLLAGYFFLSIVIFGGGLYFWATSEPEKDEEHENVMPCEDRSGEIVDNLEDEGPAEEATPDPDSSEKGSEVGSRVTTATDNPEDQSNSMPDSYVLVCDRTPRQQLLSVPFLMLLIFWTISVTSNMWVLVTTRDFLAHLGDDETGNKYLTIFTLLMPVSLVAVPFTDETLDKIGFGGAFQTINVLALMYNLIRLLSDNLNVQVFGFIVFSFFRSFLFGVCFSYLPTLLDPHVVGKATGIMYAITGATAFANIPLSKYAIEEQDGDFFIPNLIYTCLIAPCVLAAWRIGKANQLEAQVQRQLHDESSVAR